MKKFKIRYGDMIDRFDKKNYDAIVVTTNGYVKNNGEAVLGRGIAKQMSKIFPELPKLLGKKLKKKGNIVHHFVIDGVNVVTLPVKPINVVAKKSNNDHILKRKREDFKAGDIVPGFWATSNLRLITESLQQLVKLVDKKGWKHVIMPRPGCGNGELHWQDVRVVCSQLLDKRFHVHTFKPNNKAVLIFDHQLSYKMINKAIDRDIKIITPDLVLTEYIKHQGYKRYLSVKKKNITKKLLKKHKIKHINFIFGTKKQLSKVKKLLKKS